MTKKLLLTFASIVILVVVLLASLNYLVDPFLYFRWNSNILKTGLPDTNSRARCTSILTNAPSDTYQGIIVGGSKSSALNTDLLQCYTGVNWMSCSAGYGNFEYYELIIKYALEHQQLEYVVLHLSGIESYQNPPAEEVETFRIPDRLISGNDVKDKIYYLFADFNNVIESILNGTAPSLNQRFVVATSEDDEFSLYNKSNIALAEQMGILDHITNTNLLAGKAYLHTAKKEYYSFLSHGGTKDEWADTYVLNYFGPYEWCLNNLFYSERTLINAEENILRLQNIAELCDSNGVELILILGSTFLFERMFYEGPEYWNYLQSISRITDFYDFSYFCDINMNPYNFFDANHNQGFVACAMVDYIFGDGVIDYGQKVTADTFNDYILQRQANFYKLAEEYRITGDIQLGRSGDESDLSALPGNFWLDLISHYEV